MASASNTSAGFVKVADFVHLRLPGESHGDDVIILSYGVKNFNTLEFLQRTKRTFERFIYVGKSSYNNPNGCEKFLLRP